MLQHDAVTELAEAGGGLECRTRRCKPSSLLATCANRRNGGDTLVIGNVNWALAFSGRCEYNHSE